MTITLMRHGKPVLAKTGWITPIEMEGWIEWYNRSEVTADDAPIATIQIVNTSLVSLQVQPVEPCHLLRRWGLVCP